MASSDTLPQAVPNFFHAEAGAWYIQITSAICLPVIVIFAGLRVYAKLGLGRKLTWDDLTCTLGILSGIIFIILCLAGVAPANTFTHQIDMRKRGIAAPQLRLTLVLESLYGPFVWFIKLSLFVVIAQIFHTLRWLRYLAIGGVVFTGLFYISAVIALPTLCAPTVGSNEDGYRDRLGSNRCRGSFQLGIAVGTVNVLSDLYLIILPLPAVWALQLPVRRRVAIAAMFLVGLIALAASTVSFYYRIKVALNPDEVCSFNILPNWLFAIVEMAAGIVVCCMPSAMLVFNGAVKPAAKSLFSSSSHYIRSKTPSRFSSQQASSPPSSSSGSRQRNSAPSLGFGMNEKEPMGLGRSVERTSRQPIIPTELPLAHAQYPGAGSTFLWEIERAGSSESVEGDVEGGRREGGNAQWPYRGEGGIWKTSQIVVENSPKGVQR